MSRFAPYLAVVHGDRVAALDLYEWNALMSAVVMDDLVHLEVGLRNAYDRALNAATPDGAHWSDDLALHFGPLIQRAKNGAHTDANAVPRKQIMAAKGSAAHAARRKHQPVSGESIVTELSFGFWRYLSTSSYEKNLWVPFLRHGFQPYTTRKAVDGTTSRLHRVRNRVAHHEPLWSYDLAERRLDVTTLARLISPHLAAHINATSAWLDVLAQRPI